MKPERKIKITDFATLQLEKQRLKSLCEAKKLKLEEEFDFLKKNYPELGVKAILPFSENINDKIFNTARWTINTATRVTGSSPLGLLGLFSGSRAGLIKSVLIYAGSRIAKRIFQKKSNPDN
jgi:hypothetical protein